jgi:hypothetical protein
VPEVVMAPGEVIRDVEQQLIEAGRQPTTVDGTPTVVIVVEPKEALQEGDRSKIETETHGGGGNNEL